jgi:CheY-like chemotaxis protein
LSHGLGAGRRAERAQEAERRAKSAAGLKTGRPTPCSEGNMTERRDTARIAAASAVPSYRPAQAADSLVRGSTRIGAASNVRVVRGARSASRVLVVDDNGPLRKLIPRLLPDFEVVTAGDALEALLLLGTSAVDVVVTNYATPSYSGLDLLLDIAGAHPGVQRVLMSGLPPWTFDEHLESRLVHVVLPKPFTRFELERALVRPKGR